MAASRIGARDALIVATLLAAGAAYLVPLRSHGLILCDDGYYLLPATRMLAGDVLYRDILVHYPPLRYHLLAAVFSLVEPSVLAARGVWIALLLAAAALTTRVSARLVPGWLAWVPAGILLLVPGPWHKAPYALSSALFFLVLARALERPGRLRFAVAGAVAGMAVCTRQDIGFAFVGLGAAAAVLPTLLPSSLAAEQLQRRRREGLGDLASMLLGCIAAMTPVVAYYALRGALPDMAQMLFASAYRLAGVRGVEWSAAFLPSAFDSREGPGAWLILVLPPAIYAATAVLLVRRLRTRGADPTAVLLGALLAFGVVTLPQLQGLVLLVRLLQAGLPSYVLATFVLYELVGGLRGRLPGPAGSIVGGTLAALGAVAAAAFVGYVIDGAPRILPGDAYSGSARMMRLREPVRVQGQVLFTDWPLAEEIRLVRSYVGVNSKPGQPVFAWPLQTMYWPLLERPNPTGMICDHRAADDIVVSDARKRRELARLLESEARHAIVGLNWLLSPDPPERVRRTLLENFHPVRVYRSVAVLERGRDETMNRLLEVQKRLALGRPRRGDVSFVEKVTRSHPEEPYPWALLGVLTRALGDRDGAVAALRVAARLDPVDATHLERAAALEIEQGRYEEAARDLRAARAVRPSPGIRRLWNRLPAALRNSSGR